ncbi:hypothetical protein FDP41_010444 [Naegleria fowleri]|uniref:non-specific serine/threonine protein kinase n=1 Tax=Naegleria fowleri TaxID=5763 RepID=A0A6A5CDK6_NAEFO|nr:uncharacterized protein FDP41_010444 [Naegleria fowleri]KAF0983379.1 hypothetical protein FDP41_010444 [Naegleria fowleri]
MISHELDHHSLLDKSQWSSNRRSIHDGWLWLVFTLFILTINLTIFHTNLPFVSPSLNRVTPSIDSFLFNHYHLNNRNSHKTHRSWISSSPLAQLSNTSVLVKQSMKHHFKSLMLYVKFVNNNTNNISNSFETTIVNNNNCTLREFPCYSISQAFQVAEFLIQKEYQNDEWNANSTILQILLLRGGGDGIYGKSQCNLQTNYSFHEIIFQSPQEENEEGILWDCEDSHLFHRNSHYSMKMSFLNLHLLRTHVNGAIDQFYFRNVSMWNSHVMNECFWEIPIRVFFENCSMNQSSVICCASHVHILQSILEETMIRVPPGTNVTIQYSILNYFQFFKMDVRYAQYFDTSLEHFTIFHTQLSNSEMVIDEYDQTTFENLEFFGNNSIRVLYSYGSYFNNVLAIEGSLHLHFEGLNGVAIRNSIFDSIHCPFGKSVIIEVISCSALEMEFVTARGVKAPFLKTTRVQSVILKMLNFTNNSGGSCISSIAEDIAGSWIYIYGSSFRNNTCQECHGTACHLQAERIQIDGNQFLENHAYHGGAIYVKSSNLLTLSGTQFKQNVALHSGGALYVKDILQDMEFGMFSTCFNNTALYAGGCLFFENPILSHFLERRNVDMIGNHAMSYGSTIGTSLYNISYEFRVFYGSDTSYSLFTDQPELYLYPGQVLPKIELSIWNNGTEKVKFLPLPLECHLHDEEGHDGSIFLSYNNSNSNLDMSVKSLVIAAPHVKTLRMSISIQDDPIDQLFIDVLIHVEDCPPEMTLHTLPQGSFICSAKPYIPYGIVIPVAILCAIVIISVVLTLIYGLFKVMKNIFMRLKRLERKESAEKKMESKLIDKRVILMMGEDDFSTSNETTALLINSHTNGGRQEGHVHTASDNDRLPFSSLATRSWIIPIDQIEILKRIAEGGNGAVYLACWNGSKVALKTLKSEAVNWQLDQDDMNHESDEEFEREASLLGSIRHPNIVQFFGIILASSKKYMVVEYMERGSLDKLIYNAKHGIEKIDLFRKIDILLGIAKGMNYLHSLQPRGIIHRDLKPGNILLDRNFTSKICDFGLSKTLSNSCSKAATTNVGTLFYMANEMIETSSQYNHKVDVFSFAIVMWELFFEENPYLNASSQKLYKFIPSSHETGSFGVNVLFKVLKGERPIIPFRNEQEMQEWIEEFVKPHNEHIPLEKLCMITTQYVEMMKECWNANYLERPDFSEICKKLTELQHEWKR